MPPQPVSVRVITVLAVPCLILRHWSDLHFQAPKYPWFWALLAWLILVTWLIAAWQAFCTTVIQVSPMELTITQHAMGFTRTRSYPIDRISGLGTRRIFLSQRVILRFQYQGFPRRIWWQLRKDDAQSLIDKIERCAPHLAPEPRSER